MADKGSAAPKPSIAHKPPVKAMPPAPPAQQEQDAVQHVQQDLVQLPAPPPQVPNPVQPPAPPPQVPNLVQPLQMHVQPGQPQFNWSCFKPEFSGK